MVICDNLCHASLCLIGYPAAFCLAGHKQSQLTHAILRKKRNILDQALACGQKLTPSSLWYFNIAGTSPCLIDRSWYLHGKSSIHRPLCVATIGPGTFVALLLLAQVGPE